MHCGRHWTRESRLPPSGRVLRRPSEPCALANLVFFRERLTPQHNLNSFACGNHALDTWLRDSAVQADRSGTGRTYLWLSEKMDVVAYFTLAPHVVRRADVPKKIGRGAPDAIPSVLLARLALAESLHGQGLGSAVLADALAVILEAMRVAGGRLIVVDAIDGKAASFYEHHGFVQVPGNAGRLILKASVAARSLSIPWR